LTAGVCDQCGKPFAQNRRGGTRKRFCSGACRAAHSRIGRTQARLPSATATVTAEERLADLEALYQMLKADVETHGTLVAGKEGLRANPSVAEMRRVSVELGRLTLAEEKAEPDDILRAV
jgi:hypothetical protein